MAEDVKKTLAIGSGLAGPGRPKGVPNKANALLKDAIIKAATDAGGGDLAAYLQVQAVANPGPFLALLGKVLPMQIASDPDNPIITRIEIVAPVFLVDPAEYGDDDRQN